jgi:plasmid stabilization system protein ParE
MAKGDYKVLWARTAEEDLKGIVAYIAADSVDEALRVLERIRTAAAALGSLPERGRLVPELKEQGVGLYREIVVAPWRMLYRIMERKVYVLGVFDSRRNLEDLLLARLLRQP